MSFVVNSDSTIYDGNKVFHTRHNSANFFAHIEFLHQLCCFRGQCLACIWKSNSRITSKPESSATTCLCPFSRASNSIRCAFAMHDFPLCLLVHTFSFPVYYIWHPVILVATVSISYASCHAGISERIIGRILNERS